MENFRTFQVDLTVIKLLACNKIFCLIDSTYFMSLFRHLYNHEKDTAGHNDNLHIVWFNYRIVAVNNIEEHQYCIFKEITNEYQHHNKMALLILNLSKLRI